MTAFDQIVQALLGAMRRLLRTPGQVAVAAGLLVLGASLPSAIYGLVRDALFATVRFEHHERIARAYRVEADGSSRSSLSSVEFADWESEMTFLDGVSGIRVGPQVDVEAGERVLRMRAAEITPKWFEVLGVTPSAGRPLSARFSASSHPEAMLSETGAERLFGSSDTAINKTIRIRSPRGTTEYLVVGVVVDAAHLTWLEGYDAYIAAPGSMETSGLSRFSLDYQVLVRLPPGMELDTAEEAAAAQVRRIATRHPELPALGVSLVPLAIAEAPEDRTLVIALGVLAFAIVSASCAAFTGMLLTLGRARAKELYIRSALGAAPSALRRQIVSEGACLGAIAAGGSALCALLLRALLAGITPASVRGAAPPHLGWHVLVMSIVLPLAAATLSGVLAAALAHPFHSGRPAKRRWSELVLATQVVLFLSFLVPSAMTLVSYTRLITVPLGFDAGNVIALGVMMRHLQLNPDMFQAVTSNLRREIGGLPGVTSTAVADVLPLSTNRPTNVGVRIGSQDADPKRSVYRTVTSDYFALLRVRVVRRSRSAAEASECGIVVNERFASAYLHNDHTIPVYLGGMPCHISAIVANARDVAIDEGPTPSIYRDFDPHRLPAAIWLLVRYDTMLHVTMDPLLAAAARAHPGLSVEVVSLSRHVRTATERERFYASVVLVLVLVALIMMAVIIAAAASRVADESRRDTAVRMALGASRHKAACAMVTRMCGVILIGTTIGAWCGVLVGQFIEHHLFGVSVADAGVIAVSVIATWTVTLVASSLPVSATMRLNVWDELRR